MVQSVLTADYVIKGAGATAMAFADVLLSESDATMVIVDRHDRPGGHWNDAYPFVRLHQPASTYGVASMPLATGAVDQVGHNAGFHELASGQEVLGHFDLVMRQRFLTSGRVQYLPMSELSDDGTVTSLLSGAQCRVDAPRFVDATHSRMRVPSTTPPSYTVSPEVTCVPLNDLPRVAPGYDGFVVIGAGKTGMDACLWLLDNGATPEQIRWIVPRDSWVIDRATVQPGPDHFAALCKAVADQVEAVVRAESIEDLFARLEAFAVLRRLDAGVTPGAYHCAILSEAEMAQLRRITDVVRLGRVQAIDSDEIRLDGGVIPTGPGQLHIDCSAAGIPTHPSVSVFDGERITLQWVRTCQPTYSAAMIGFVECRFDDEAVKNRICQPIVPPTVPMDWLRMFRVELENRSTMNEFAEVGAWSANCRLDPFGPTASTRLGADAEATAHIGRYLEHVGAAVAKLDQLLAADVAG